MTRQQRRLRWLMGTTALFWLCLVERWWPRPYKPGTPIVVSDPIQVTVRTDR